MGCSFDALSRVLRRLHPGGETDIGGSKGQLSRPASPSVRGSDASAKANLRNTHVPDAAGLIATRVSSLTDTAQESLLSQKHLCQTGQQPPQRLTPARVAKAADAPAGTSLERLGGVVAGPPDSPSVADGSSGAFKSSASQRAAALKALKAQRHTPALSHTSKNSDAEVASEQSNGRTAATSMPQQELTSSNQLTENDTHQPDRSSSGTLASQLPLATNMAHYDSCSHSRQTITATAVVADPLSSDADGCQGCQILTLKAPTDQGKSHQPDHSMHYHDQQAAAAELTKAQAALEQQSQDVLQAKAVNLQLQQELQDSNQKAAQAVAALDELQGAYSMLLKQHAVLSLEAQEQQAELSDQLVQAKALQAAAQHRAEAAQVLMESQATSEFAAMEAMQMQLTALSAEKQSLATQLAKAQRDAATVYAKKLEREAALTALKKKCGNLAASVVAQQSEAATLEARLASARQRVHSLEKAVEKERAARERAEREVTMLKEEVSVMVAIINGNATLVQALEEEVAHRQLAVKGWSEAPRSPARRRTLPEELSTPARSRPVMAPGDCELTPMSIPLRQAAAAAAAAMTAAPRATSAESRAQLPNHQPPASPAQRQLHRYASQPRCQPNQTPPKVSPAAPEPVAVFRPAGCASSGSPRSPCCGSSHRESCLASVAAAAATARRAGTRSPSPILCKGSPRTHHAHSATTVRPSSSPSVLQHPAAPRAAALLNNGPTTRRTPVPGCTLAHDAGPAPTATVGLATPGLPQQGTQPSSQVCSAQHSPRPSYLFASTAPSASHPVGLAAAEGVAAGRGGGRLGAKSPRPGNGWRPGMPYLKTDKPAASPPPPDTVGCVPAASGQQQDKAALFGSPLLCAPDGPVRPSQPPAPSRSEDQETQPWQAGSLHMATSSEDPAVLPGTHRPPSHEASQYRDSEQSVNGALVSAGQQEGEADKTSSPACHLGNIGMQPRAAVVAEQGRPTLVASDLLARAKQLLGSTTSSNSGSASMGGGGTGSSCDSCKSSTGREPAPCEQHGGIPPTDRRRRRRWTDPRTSGQAQPGGAPSQGLTSQLSQQQRPLQLAQLPNQQASRRHRYMDSSIEPGMAAGQGVALQQQQSQQVNSQQQQQQQPLQGTLQWAQVPRAMDGQGRGSGAGPWQLADTHRGREPSGNLLQPDHCNSATRYLLGQTMQQGRPGSEAAGSLPALQLLIAGASANDGPAAVNRHSSTGHGRELGAEGSMPEVSVTSLAELMAGPGRVAPLPSSLQPGACQHQMLHGDHPLPLSPPPDPGTAQRASDSLEDLGTPRSGQLSPLPLQSAASQPASVGPAALDTGTSAAKLGGVLEDGMGAGEAEGNSLAQVWPSGLESDDSTMRMASPLKLACLGASVHGIMGPQAPTAPSAADEPDAAEQELPQPQLQEPTQPQLQEQCPMPHQGLLCPAALSEHCDGSPPASAQPPASGEPGGQNVAGSGDDLLSSFPPAAGEGVQASCLGGSQLPSSSPTPTAPPLCKLVDLRFSVRASLLPWVSPAQLPDLAEVTPYASLAWSLSPPAGLMLTSEPSAGGAGAAANGTAAAIDTAAQAVQPAAPPPDTPSQLDSTTTSTHPGQQQAVAATQSDSTLALNLEPSLQSSLQSLQPSFQSGSVAAAMQAGTPALAEPPPLGAAHALPSPPLPTAPPRTTAAEPPGTPAHKLLPLGAAARAAAGAAESCRLRLAKPRTPSPGPTAKWSPVRSKRDTAPLRPRSPHPCQPVGSVCHPPQPQPTHQGEEPHTSASLGPTVVPGAEQAVGAAGTTAATSPQFCLHKPASTTNSQSPSLWWCKEVGQGQGDPGQAHSAQDQVPPAPSHVREEPDAATAPTSSSIRQRMREAQDTLASLTGILSRLPQSPSRSQAPAPQDCTVPQPMATNQTAHQPNGHLQTHDPQCHRAGRLGVSSAHARDTPPSVAAVDINNGHLPSLSGQGPSQPTLSAEGSQCQGGAGPGHHQAAQAQAGQDPAPALQPEVEPVPRSAEGMAAKASKLGQQRQRAEETCEALPSTPFTPGACQSVGVSMGQAAGSNGVALNPLPGATRSLLAGPAAAVATSAAMTSSAAELEVEGGVRAAAQPAAADQPAPLPVGSPPQPVASTPTPLALPQRALTFTQMHNRMSSLPPSFHTKPVDNIARQLTPRPLHPLPNGHTAPSTALAALTQLRSPLPASALAAAAASAAPAPASMHSLAIAGVTVPASPLMRPASALAPSSQPGQPSAGPVGASGLGAGLGTAAAGTEAGRSLALPPTPSSIRPLSLAEVLRRPTS
ncbi:hypothetical protein V8C86DRAFT_2644221 [Haematococcus lacustris]